MADTEFDRANAARIHQLETLERLSLKFGQSLSGALGQNLGAGRQLDGVLSSLGNRLTGIAAKAAMGPVKAGLTSLVKAVLSAAVGGGGESGSFARGGVFSGGRVRPFAEGGVVAAPTYFPMQGGTGLMGEAGPEAILPLRRGSDGRLGVAAGGGGRPVSVTVNIATPDAASFRRSEAQVAAALSRAVARGQRAL